MLMKKRSAAVAFPGKKKSSAGKILIKACRANRMCPLLEEAFWRTGYRSGRTIARKRGDAKETCGINLYLYNLQIPQ